MSEWDPNEFMGEACVGRLATQCMDNRKVQFPDGTQVTKESTGFVVRNRHGREMGVHTGTSTDSARSAAQHALDASAQSRNPKSVGGRRRYANLQKVKDEKPLDPGIVL